MKMYKYEKHKIFREWFYLEFEIFANVKGFGFWKIKTLNLHQGVWILN